MQQTKEHLGHFTGARVTQVNSSQQILQVVMFLLVFKIDTINSIFKSAVKKEPEKKN